MEKIEQYKEYLADCYLLSTNRTKSLILGFLDKFIPNREESADEYEVPQYAENPQLLFSTELELIDFLAEKKHEPHTIYWRSLDKSEIRNVMCFFTNDGNVIFGISTETKYPNTEIEENVFTQMKDYLLSSEGYITYEEPAPNNTEEFKIIIKARKHNMR